MKVSVPNDNKVPKKVNFEGILPLLVGEQEPKQLKKGTYSRFHLRTVPSDTMSPTYDFVVPYLYGASTVRQAIQFRKKMNRVISGLNVTTCKTDKKSSSNNNHKSKGKRKHNSDDSSKHCMLHGKGSHSTKECKTLKAKTKRLKDNKSKGESKNKSWKRKDDKKEINVAEATKKEVTKQVKAAFKELNAVQS